MENAEQNVELSGSAKALRQQLGEHLQRARLNQQKDGVDVARRLMLSKLQLLAIEAGQAESFHHERRYIQSIKSYVLYLNLDQDPVVSDLLKQVEGFSVAGQGASPAAGVAQLHLSGGPPTSVRTYAARRPKFIYLAIGLLIVGAVALALSEGWPFSDDEEQITIMPSGQTDAQSAASTRQSAQTNASEVTSVVVMPLVSVIGGTSSTSSQANAGASSQAAATSSATPSMISAPTASGGSTQTATLTPPGIPAPAAKTGLPVSTSGPSLMRIDFTADCWVLLQTSDGKKEDRIFKQGQYIEVPAATVTALVLGNAPAAKMTLGSKQVDIMTKNLTQGNITRLDQKNLQVLQKN